MSFLHAYFVGRVIARALQTKPMTAQEIAKNAALGWLYFLVFCTAVTGAMAGAIWLMNATSFLTTTIVIVAAGVAFLAYRIPRM